jgi:hypothetical protein
MSNQTEQQEQHRTLDECVRAVTAASSFDDLKDTLPSYAPTFYARRFTADELAAARRVTSAFNAWAARPENGRGRLAEVVL